MDFFQICTREVKGGVLEVYPDFTVSRSKDLMVRAGSFYAIWDEDQNLWSTDEYDVQRFVDQALKNYADKLTTEGHKCSVKFLRSFSSNGWTQFRKFMKNVSDNAHQLDENLTFANSETKKTDYVSRKLPYSLDSTAFCPAWDELLSVLYSPEQREKIEWAIGAIMSGDAKKLHKFLVFYGPPGTGKSTVLNVVEKLFEGYVTTFEAKALVGNNNAFATEVFKNNPLVAIQHDGDLSKVEDNSKLNSIISHEPMTMNEKFKPSYTARILAFLMMGTNKPVKITDAKAGLIRRLIDVHPTGEKIKGNHYNTLMAQIDFELGAIAAHCLDVYRTLGKNHFNSYRPMEMMLQTDVFFNFVEANFDTFKSQDGVSLRQAYALYKEYCSETGIEFVMPQYKVREELRNYFAQFVDRYIVDGVTLRSYYLGFTAKPFKAPVADDKAVFSLVLDETISLLDDVLGGYPAQYAKVDGSPRRYWSDAPRIINGELKTPKPTQVVDTVLSDLDTTKEHYVKVPLNHIVIDFDLKDDDGGKSLERNLAAASEWPATYAELSKSGSGVHLHYIYTGDADELDSVYMDGVEVKVYRGDASLRRRLSKCNNVPVSSISSGLPFKEKKVVPATTMQSERGLRELIARNLRKEIHPGTKPSVDFIHKILQDAHDSGMSYDVTDLRGKIIAFANNSTNQALACLKVVQHMKFRGRQEDIQEVYVAPDEEKTPVTSSEPLVFFDVEVYPNLFLICWKYAGSPTVVSMVNPTPAEVEQLFKFKLIGFYARRYDNHMLWARFMGYSNEQLFKLSQKIIDNNTNALFGEAYKLSYADIYDFSSVKQSLKKWQIDLGIHHMELDLPWDQPVEDSDIPRIIEYCTNDVISEEVVFNARKGDFAARQILAELSGLTVNDTTAKHTARIIFGEDRTPQRSFIYTDLSKEFPGYVYGAVNDKGTFIAKSTYRGEEVGEGGYVYAEPGMYDNVAVLDVASMHPTSIVQLNLFGQYTPSFQALLEARLAIKNKRFDEARTMFGGRLAPYLNNPEEAKALSDALKIVINIVYGLTSAKFDNPFRDIRNRDNIVAKRGALFMIDLKHAVQEMGFQVVHIKTDSIKIPHATPEIIAFVREYGAKYGYDFEYDPNKDLYEKFCLVNDAVYIARKKIPVQFDGDEVSGTGPLQLGFKFKWDAVGAQFQHPFVYKTLFSGEEINFDDLCEAKSVVAGVMYLDFQAEKPMFQYDKGLHHVGRTGRFVPVKPELGGGILFRVKDGKNYAVAGTKGYFWVEAELAKDMPMSDIDMSYFHRLIDEAKSAIGKFGDFSEFVN